jgi:hypothetical protein
MVGLEFLRSTLTVMKYMPSKLTQLPSRLRKAIEIFLTKPGFNSYARLAQWIHEQGCEVTVTSLRRYRVGLAQRLNSTRPQKARSQKSGLSMARTRRKKSTPAISVNRQTTTLAPPRSPAGSAGAGVTTEGLMRLTREKLCSALIGIGQFQEGNTSRLAHAVAHLTQSAVSFQRWTMELEQRAGERGRSGSVTRSALRKGLSPETSEALRKALLGIAPFESEPLVTQQANPTEDSADSVPAPVNSDETMASEKGGEKL